MAKFINFLNITINMTSLKNSMVFHKPTFSFKKVLEDYGNGELLFSNDIYMDGKIFVHNNILGRDCDIMLIKSLTIDCWLKNNKDWYYPEKKIDIFEWDNVDLLSISFYGDLFYAYQNGNKENGRLYKGDLILTKP